MKRSALEAAIADTVVEGKKALGLLGSRKEDEVRMNIMISLNKGASMENLEDMAGFIRFAVLHKKEDAWVIGNLMHDINGLANNELCLSPRTTGYATI